MENNKTNEKTIYFEKDNMIKLTPKFIAILSFIILNTIFVLNMYNKSYEKKDILRLHIVANSNSLEDQLVKLKVTEKIEKYIDNLSELCNSKSEMISILKDSNNTLMELSDNTLKENGFEYETKLKIGKIEYSEKESLTTHMEKGTYDSVQIVLGNGNGKNFWTLIFPNKENIHKLKGYETIMPFISNIYDDNESTVEYNSSDTNDTNENINKEYTFKLLEIIENLKNKI